MADLRFYTSIDSTNKEARRLLAQGPVLDGLTLLTYEQTEGRGQYARTWTAEPGANLTISIIHTPPDLPVKDLPLINMKVTLGIIHALHTLEPDLTLRIKWPNDIYVRDKKLCGILIENALSEGRVQDMIIGIGMNVNETSFPTDLPNPVSLIQCTGKKYDLPALAELIRDGVMLMLTSGPTGWKSAYDNLLYGLGTVCHFESDGLAFHGMITGVDLEGRMLVKMEDGEVKAYGSHEVRMIMG